MLEYILKKYNLTPAKFVEIPNVSRLDIVRWVRELDFKVGVEVGVATGEFAKLLVVGNNQLKLYGVDPYIPLEGYNEYTKEETFNWFWEEAVRRLGANGHGFRRFEFIKETSVEASKRFEDNSLDFVYIDANHEEKFVYEDISVWAEKVKPGGFVSGHDYIDIRFRDVEGERFNYGVKKAVHRYVKEHNLPLFILGLKEQQTGLVREGIRSWVFPK